MDPETMAEIRVIAEKMDQHDNRAKATNELIREDMLSRREWEKKQDLFHFGHDGRGGINAIVMAHQQALLAMKEVQDAAQKKRDVVISIMGGVLTLVAGAVILQAMGLPS